MMELGCGRVSRVVVVEKGQFLGGVQEEDDPGPQFIHVHGNCATKQRRDWMKTNDWSLCYVCVVRKMQRMLS
jgi:hypothetical protein